ncbi:dendritic cell-specific transmembrane protein-like [Sardina pilchardus]|uniref:dendritic cell-specific transmembrane protein-like n=1 Tax=Sardina pilchardus TaxID=27697 RepID=UPI002E0DE6D4
MGSVLPHLVRLFTTDHRSGCRDISLHLLSCLLLSLLLGFLLLLGLLYSLQYSLQVSGIISGCTVLLLTSALFVSQRVRCFALLFLVSCALQQGRNLLLAAGIGLVLLWNVGNTFRNLQSVAQSIVCNLKTQLQVQELPSSPLQTQVNMIRRTCDRMSNFFELGVVSFSVDTRVDGYAESDEAREKLQEATQMLNATAEKAEAIYDAVSSVGSRVTPGIGVLVLALMTVLFLKMCRQNKRFLNSYITPAFVRYDEQQRSEGRPHVLPLTKKEAKRYPSVPSARPTLSDGQSILMFFLPVVVHLLTWSALIGLDALLYWIIQTVNRHMRQFRPIEVPLKVSLNGAPMAFFYSIEMFKKECLPQPTFLLSEWLAPLSVILVVLAIMGLLSPKFLQAKMLLIEKFYDDCSADRVQHLHAKIVRKRSKKKLRALKSTLVSYATNVKFWFPIFFPNKTVDGLQLHENPRL